jgi:K+-sensing histidine kinase KdpD
LVASVALALLTLICYRLHFNLATASILYVIVVVLLARTGTFVSSVVASIIAALGLAYLAPPEFSFRVSNPFDDVSIVAS